MLYSYIFLASWHGNIAANERDSLLFPILSSLEQDEANCQFIPHLVFSLLLIVPEWYSFTKNWYLVRQAKQRGQEVKKISTDIATKTADFVTESSNNAADAVAGFVTEEASRVRENVLGNPFAIGSYDYFLDNEMMDIHTDHLKKLEAEQESNGQKKRGHWGTLQFLIL